MTTEIVSVSFHFAEKLEISDGDSGPGCFDTSDIQKIHQALTSRMGVDFEDPHVQDVLRNRRFSPIEHIESLSDREICGLFWATYSGHEYENLDKGTITAGSVSLRKFYFHIYLSDSGVIYIGVQYLGQYGGYTQFKATIEPALRGDDHYPQFGSINSSEVDIGKATIEEIQVSWAKGSQSVNVGNSFGDTGMIVIKRNKDGSNNEALNGDVKGRIIQSMKGQDAAKSKKEISNILQENKLLKLKDDEISDVSLLVSIDKRKKRVRLIEASALATRFQVNVKKSDNGHPVYDEIKAETTKLLDLKIINVVEDV